MTIDVERLMTLQSAHELFCQPRTILVVDDDAAVLDAIADVIRDEGYRVDTANNGTSALKYLDSHSPQLIYLDLMMPGMNGWQVVEEIRKRYPQSAIPIVLLSAVNRLSEEAERLHIKHFLRKPFHLVDVTRLADQLCHRPG